MLRRILFDSVAILRTLHQKSPSLVSFWVSPNKLLNFPESISSPVKRQRYLHLTAEEPNGARKHFVLRQTQIHTLRSRNTSSPRLVCRQQVHSAKPPGPWSHAQRENEVMPSHFWSQPWCLKLKTDLPGPCGPGRTPRRVHTNPGQPATAASAALVLVKNFDRIILGPLQVETTDLEVMGIEGK